MTATAFAIYYGSALAGFLGGLLKVYLFLRGNC